VWQREIARLSTLMIDTQHVHVQEINDMQRVIKR
jgi:hypothetical protein